MAFATVSDVADRVNRTLTVGEQAQAGLLLDTAAALIQNYTGQTIERVVDDTATLAGTWERALELPELPVVSVTSVTVDEQTVTGWELTVDGQLVGVSWGGPDVTVTVVYTHGHDPVPDDVWAVCVEMVARAMENPRALQSESESIGSYSHSQVYGVGGTSRGVYLAEHERTVVGRYRQTVFA